MLLSEDRISGELTDKECGQAAAFKDHMDYFCPEDTESVFGPNVDAYYPRVILAVAAEGGKNTS